MKRQLTAILLALFIFFCLLPLSAAASGAYSWTGEWETDWGDMILTQTGTNVTGTYDYDDGIITGTVSGDTLTGTWAEAPSYAPPHDAGDIEFVMSADGRSFTGKWRYGSEGSWGNWDGGIRLGEPVLAEQSVWGNISSWAAEEVQEAVDNGLYPDVLSGADLTKSITRAEFAAVAVKLYEALSGTTAAPAPSNTFTDTQDADVLKAYALNIVDGVGGGRFAPYELLNREQAATILARVYKKLNWEGWTLAGDAAYTAHSLDNKGVALFADDAQISAYARASVYFMAKYEIIKGLENNKFGPKNTTSAETAAGYANATREQSLLISNRTFETADSIIDGGPVTPPTVATSGSIVGKWYTGDISGGLYNSISGRYEGAAGLGEIYYFNDDGTYYEMIIFSSYTGTYALSITGKYSVKDGMVTFTNRVAEDSTDGGNTWSAKKSLPDQARYYALGSDILGPYLLIGLEDAQPPLDHATNAAKYWPGE
jgi:hypothetical protein